MWRVTELATEGIRNLLAHHARTAISAVFIGILVGSLALTEYRIADDLATFTRTLAASGGHVVVASTSEPVLDAQRCDELGRHPGVVAAGAIRDTGAGRLETSGGALVSRMSYTGTALRIIDPGYDGPRDAGYVAGAAAAERHGLHPGAIALFALEPSAPVVGTLTSATRMEQFETALLADTRAERAHQCLIEVTPGNLVTARELLAATYSSDAAAIRPLLSQSDFQRDPVTELRQRPQQWLWLVVAGAIALVMGLGLHFRRAERAVYAAHGARRTDLTIIDSIEAVSVILFGATSGILWMTVVALAVGIDPHFAYAIRLPAAATLLACSLTVGSSLALYPRRVLFDQLKGG